MFARYEGHFHFGIAAHLTDQRVLVQRKRDLFAFIRVGRIGKVNEQAHGELDRFPAQTAFGTDADAAVHADEQMTARQEDHFHSFFPANLAQQQIVDEARIYYAVLVLQVRYCHEPCSRFFRQAVQPVTK